MKVVYNIFIPFKGFTAMNVFGLLFARKEYKGRLSQKTLNHEAIHSAQYKELGYIFFLPLYLLEWFVKLFYYGFRSKVAYRNISFEREAFEHQYEYDYLKSRKHYAWVKKIFKA